MSLAKISLKRWMQRTSSDSRNLFKRLLCFYGGLLIGIILLLTVYFLSLIRNQILEGQRENMAQLLDEASEILERDGDSASYLQADLYKSQQELWDLLHYLTDEQEDYLAYRLDNFPDTGGGSYRGCEAFFKDAMDSNPYLERVDVISYGKRGKTSFHADGSRTIEGLSREELSLLLDGQDKVSRAGELAFFKELKNPASFDTVGCVIYTYNTGQFTNLMKVYSKGRLLVFHENGGAIFTTDNIDGSSLLSDGFSGSHEDLLEAQVEETVIGSYHILSYLPDAIAGLVPANVFALIIAIAVAFSSGGLFLIRRSLLGLEGRLDRILDGMQEVTKGNLQVTLESSPAGDELDLISENFNVMCRQLEDYIRKSYLAEIEQKNAEMAALQSQINPHFLYNTLEAIRMKAICNGDREVGKMLYSMAVMFRSQIKEADVITIAQELHYTKKYLELFEYRYQNRFRSDVECPAELMKLPVIKFILQPIVENYFVHGIRMEKEDNRLRITVARERDYVCIYVEDNGRGMPEDKRRAENQELSDNKSIKGKSIGLSNVNLRLKAVYGDDCGVSLENSGLGGVKVELRLRPEAPGKELEDEESNAGGR